MTLLLYDYCDLEARASRHLNVWKAWHLILYAFAGIFGILNYVFLRNTMELVDSKCVLFPRELAFHSIEVPTNISSINDTVLANSDTTENALNDNAPSVPVLVLPTTVTPNEDKNETVTERDVTNTRQNYTDLEDSEIDGNFISANVTHRTVLDTSRTVFGGSTDCQYAEYMPIMSMIFAAVWATFFTMCPAGGYTKSGLQQPWRILTPALLFALVMVGLTGHSFTTTNRGLYTFCSAFYNVTNATTCSAVDPYLAGSVNATWGFGGRAGAARAASAGTWASWACAAALFLARCLAAPDYDVKRTNVYLRDPQQKLTPYLKKSSRRRGHPNKSNNSSPTKRETASIRSEPTVTTELVTVSMEQGQDTAPTTPEFSPKKRVDRDIEMSITSHK